MAVSTVPRTPARRNPIAEQKWQMRGLVAGLAAVLLALIAQGELFKRVLNQPFSVTDAEVLFAVGAALMLWAAGPRPWTDRAEAADATNGWHWPRAIARVERVQALALATLLTDAIALILFGRNVQLNLAWLFYIASVVLALVTAYQLDPPGVRSLAFRRPRFELVALGLIIVVALFFRIYHITSQPYGLWYDEAAHGLDAERILHDPSFRPVWLTTVTEAALHWYWQALLFAIFGVSKLTLRISPIVGGTLGVFACYLLARELFGWRTGLVAGAIISVSTWHVNFSRIDFNAIWSVSFDALCAYFLFKAFRTRRFFDFAMAGFCLGIGLNLYYTSRLFCGVVLLIVLYKLALGRIGFIRSSGAGLVVALLALLVTFSPLGEFAIEQPDVFLGRVDQVSVFNQMQQAHSIEPLRSNIQRHLLMFNYQGDPNGRHNLSGWPQLDRVTGGLFLLGLILCLRFARRPNFLFPLISLVIILLGGVLSLDFEAPQSLRSIDNSLTTTIIAALPISMLWTRLAELKLGGLRLPTGYARWSGALAISTGGLATLAVLAWTADVNFQRYFVAQANDNRSYAEFSIQPTLLAEKMNQLGPDYTAYMSAVFIGQPTTKFLAPRIGEERQILPAAMLPLRDDTGVALFVNGPDAEYISTIRRMYPNAQYETYRLNASSPVVMYSVVIPRDQVLALRGLTASYYAGTTTDKRPTITRTDRTIDFDWSAGKTPLPVPFVASWTGTIDAPTYGSYAFRLDAPPGATLTIDQQQMLKDPGQARVTLPQGLHQIAVQAAVTAPTQVRLSWQTPDGGLRVVPNNNLFIPPADNRGLLGTYYPSRNWTGQPGIERIDPDVDFEFHLIPLPRPYTVEWTGKLDIPTDGIYRFATNSISYSWVYIDGQLVVQNDKRIDDFVTGAIQLKNGLHDIKIRFLDADGGSHIYVYWQPPNAPQSFLPGDRLFPPQAAYPVRAGPLSATPPPPNPAPQVAPAAPAAPAAESNAAVGVLPPAAYQAPRLIGQAGAGAGQLANPSGVAVDDKGNLYVADTGNARVDKYDATGKFVAAWGSKGDGDEQFQEPVAALFDRDGNLVVLDSKTGWLKKFTPDGKFVAKLGGAELGLYQPRGFTLAPDGDYYIADTGGSHIVRVDSTGKVIARLGTKGQAPGQIGEPVSVAVDANGVFYVTDTVTNRLSRFDASFKYIDSWPIAKSASVTGPHVALGSDGSIFVTDPENHRVVHYDTTGKPVDQIGGGDTIGLPVGIWIDAQGTVYVVDSARGQVAAFAPR